MGKLSDKVWGEESPPPNSRIAEALRAQGVSRTPDFERIYALPKRELKLDIDLTPVFKKQGGTLTLRPIQSAALLEAEQAGGLVAPIAVGGGKTLILLLLAEAFHCERFVILVPPELKRQLIERDIPYYSKHFNLPKFEVLSYSELSNPRLNDEKSSILDRLCPDGIGADEAHRLRNRSSAGASRFFQFMKKNPECKFAALSGSLMSKSLKDYAHIVKHALKDNSPVPLDYRSIQMWSEALDPPGEGKQPYGSGALTLFMETPTDDVHTAFRNRLRSTLGWVSTVGSSCSSSLYVRARVPMVPSNVATALSDLRTTWEIGGTEEHNFLDALELNEAMSLSRVARQVACGFYYRWMWPKGEPDTEWLDARRNWARDVRGFLTHRHVAGMDSPHKLYCAARDGKWESGRLAWEEWQKVEGRCPPPREAVWLSDYLVQDTVKWAKKFGQGIIWSPHIVLGEAIAKALNAPWFGLGADAGSTSPGKDPIIVCSVKSQSEGKNLQAWSKNLLLSPSSNATTWEQTLGRTFRTGQESDEVWFDVILSTDENKKAFDKARLNAESVYKNFGTEQLLLKSTLVNIGGF